MSRISTSACGRGQGGRDPIRDAPVTPSGDSSAKSRLGGVHDSRKSEGDGLKWAIVEEQDEGRDPGVDSQVKIVPK